MDNHFKHDFDLKVYRVMLTHLSAVIFLPSTLFNIRITRIRFITYWRIFLFSSSLRTIWKSYLSARLKKIIRSIV